jgi:hypothetical protein
MINRLLQAMTITLLLNAIVHISPQEANQFRALSPSKTFSQIMLSLR